MSTLAYAAMTTKREESEPGTSDSTSPPGVKNYVDALAALVPAEVLSLHAAVLAYAVKTVPGQGGNPTTVVTDQGTLFGAFIALCVLSVVFYVAPRLGKLNKLDFFRAAIPLLAFVGWTMLQKVTAFDAVFPGIADAPRNVTALILAVVLGLLATTLAEAADKQSPTGRAAAQKAVADKAAAKAAAAKPGAGTAAAEPRPR